MPYPPQGTAQKFLIQEIRYRNDAEQTLTQSLIAGQSYFSVLQQTPILQAISLQTTMLTGHIDCDIKVDATDHSIEVAWAMMDRTTSLVDTWKANPNDPASIPQDGTNDFNSVLTASITYVDARTQSTVHVSRALAAAFDNYTFGLIWWATNDDPINTETVTANVRNLRAYFLGYGRMT